MTGSGQLGTAATDERETSGDGEWDTSGDSRGNVVVASDGSDEAARMEGEAGKEGGVKRAEGEVVRSRLYKCASIADR